MNDQAVTSHRWVSYRATNDWDQISAEAHRVAALVGVDTYRALLSNIGKGVNNKGYVSELDDLRFGLELQLFNIEVIRGRLSKLERASPKLHEAINFILGVGQTLPQLSERARRELRGKIIGGLKTTGLRPLYHEFRVAAKLANTGCEFCFTDLELSGGPDFVVRKKGVEYEIEAKNVTMFLGHPIQPQDAENLFFEIRRGFTAWQNREQYPVFTICFKGRLLKTRQHLLEIVDALNDLASSLDRNDYAETDWFRIEHDIMMDKREYVKIKKIASNFDVPTRGLVYFPLEHPRTVVKLKSERKDKFFVNVTALLSEAAKRQLSGTRPAIIWLHTDYLNQSSFEFYSDPNSPRPVFAAIANAVFGSEKRRHVTQLIFSGAEYLDQKEVSSRSSHQAAIFNSPHWQGAFLFDGGRQQRSRRLDEYDWFRLIRQNQFVG